jgi:hypothetical protein
MRRRHTTTPKSHTPPRMAARDIVNEHKPQTCRPVSDLPRGARPSGFRSTRQAEMKFLLISRLVAVLAETIGGHVRRCSGQKTSLPLNWAAGRLARSRRRPGSFACRARPFKYWPAFLAVAPLWPLAAGAPGLAS